MIKYFVFKILLEDTGEIVRLESVPIISQYYKYDRVNQYYKQYVTYDYDLINNDRNDLYSIVRISEIKVGESRRCIFADGSYMLFKRKSKTNYEYFFYAPNGGLYNEISGVEQNFTYTGIERKYLALGGPTSTIEYTTPNDPKCGSYSADMPDGGIGSYEKTNTALTGQYTYSSYITNTKGTGYPITYGHALIGNLINNAQYKDPKFISDTSTTGGGDGDYDDNSSDTIGLPDLTTLNANSINNTRFFTCYKLTPEQLTKLSQELWSTNFINIISNSVLKPTDFIVSMNMIPIDVMSTPKMIKAGQWLLNGAIGGVVSGQFFRVDCGSIEIKKKWGGALDYLTKIALFLPFIGEVQLSPDDVMGSTISVIYTVDVMTGSCLASVKIVRDNLDAILYQYNGNCSATYPIVSQDYSALMSGVLQLGIHSIADYTKSLPQLKRNGSNQWVIDNTKISRKENLESGATSCLFDISPNVQRVGNMSSTVGFMGIKKPFIILSRPIQSLAKNYNTYRGFVSNIAMTLKDCIGYTEVEEIHLENISATENEISEIENLLKSGVIF